MAIGLLPFTGQFLATSTGVLAGAVGLDGKEYLFGTLANFPAATAPVPAVVASNVVLTGGTINGTSVGATTPSTGAFTTFSATGAFTVNPANVNVQLAASGTGFVTVGASGTGSTTITRVNSLTVVSSDSSGTPGNATNNNLSGRAAFAAAASTVVITNSQVTAASKVFVSLIGTADATLKYVTVTAGAGTFTVTGNAAATATTVFDFFVVN